jgi:hypothetical protein
MTLTHCLKMLIRASMGTDQNVLSTKLESSKLVLEDCAGWIDRLADQGLVDPGEWEIQVTTIRNVWSGATIYALPATVTALRGRKGDVLIDEAAWVPNLREVIASAKPLAMWGGKLSLISSVFPVPNYFTSLCRSGEWDLLEIPLRGAVAQGLYHRICQETGQPEPTPEQCDEWVDDLIRTAGTSADHEYNCLESTDGGNWVGADSRLRDIPVIQLDQGVWRDQVTPVSGEHSIGVDVGGSGTVTALVAADSQGVCAAWELIGWNQTIVADLIEYLANDDTTAIAIDTNGIGLGLADILEARGVSIRRTPNQSGWFRSTCLQYLTAILTGAFWGISDQQFMVDHSGAEVTKGSVSLRKSGDRHCELVPASAMAWQYRPGSGDSAGLSIWVDIWGCELG